MAYVNFWKGLEANYNSETHKDGIYQCTDTGNTYIFGVLNKNSIGYEDKYCIAEWSDDPNQLEILNLLGDLEFARDYHPVLVDTRDNQNETTKIVGMLMDNNILRFSDGSFAPAVCITPERKAECDVELYLDPDHTQKYCDAGTFNPVDFYNEYGMADLYDINGNKVNVLRPWETTETYYSNMITRSSTVYHLDRQKGASGRIWSGIFGRPVNWDGIDITEFKLVPTGLSASKCCTIDGKLRSFYYLFEADHANCKSNKTLDGIDVVGTTKAVFPRISDISQITAMNYARANNSDPTKPYPFAEGGLPALLVFSTCLEIYNKTKNIIGIYGSGSSSNDNIDVDTVEDKGGLRINGTSVLKFNQNITYGDGNVNYLSYYLSSYKPLFPCMEPIVAASYANERKIADGEWFEFYGNQYKVTRIYPDKLDCIVIKKISFTKGSDNMELFIRASITFGANYMGDIWAHVGGGYETVGTCSNVTPGANGVGQTNECYIQYDQTQWHSETAIYKDDLGKFDFESTYKKVSTFQDISDGWRDDRIPNTPCSVTRVSNSQQGDSFYNWMNNYWGTVLNRRVRREMAMFARSNYAECSLRPCSLTDPVSNTNLYLSCLAQAQLDLG